MALLTQQVQRFLLTKTNNSNKYTFETKKNPIIQSNKRIAIEAPSSIGGVAGIKWGLTKLQGARDEMEDDAFIVQPDTLNGFSFAAVFDGHGGSAHLGDSSAKIKVGPIKLTHFSSSITSKAPSRSRNQKPSGRQVWRRRKLTKKDEYLEDKMQRTPFLEEQIRKVREGGGVLAGDIDRLMKSQENRFQFVNEVAAEATAFVENNRDEYGDKKAILHVLSNRMNDAGFARSEAYLETDPFSPGPDYLKENFY